MKFIKLPVMLGLCVTVVSCGLIPKVETPQTPQAFRETVPKTKYIVKESYTVNKKLSEVSRVWEERHKKCLDVTVESSVTRGFSTSTTYNDYNPRIEFSPGKTQLTVQFERGGNTSSNALPPPGGIYFMVADATQLKGNKTLVEIYRMNFPKDYSIVSKAIIGWAEGKKNTCPDLVAMDSTFGG